MTTNPNLCKVARSRWARALASLLALVAIAAAFASQSEIRSLRTPSGSDPRPGPALAAKEAVVVEVLYTEEELRVEHTVMKKQAEEVLRFLYDDDLIWSITAAHVRIGASFVIDEDHAALLAPGTDLDGNGFPDFLVETSTGGRLGGYEYTWLEWHADVLVVRDHLVTGAAAFHTARDITGDGVPKLWIRDTQFLYWRASRAESVAKDVIIAFDDDGFHVARDLMAQPAPSEDELAQIAAELRVEIARMVADDDMREQQKLAAALRYRHTVYGLTTAKDEDGLISFATRSPHPARRDALDDDTFFDETFDTSCGTIHLPPPRLWDMMLDLVYAGHEDLADQFLDQAWPPNVDGKVEFRQDFWETLVS